MESSDPEQFIPIMNEASNLAAGKGRPPENPRWRQIMAASSNENISSPPQTKLPSISTFPKY